MTIAVLPLGCSEEAFRNLTVPSDCAISRGGLFNTNASTTWQDQGYLGYLENVDFGLETVGLGPVSGPNGPSLGNQTVGTITATSSFYLFVWSTS